MSSAADGTSALFDAAIRRFDEENARDPNFRTVDGEDVPYELFYARKLAEWVKRLCPFASESLLLAAHCQHLCRWMIPRSSYPEGRAGYLKWRTDLKEFHAKKSAEILAEVGYPEEVIARVQALNLKKAKDLEAQTLEDALCLVTLQYQLADLMKKVEPWKMPGILLKTWKKMSPAAHEAALALPYSAAEKALLQQVLSSAGGQ